MARVLVLTDRQPSDPDWKGAFAWSLIRSLADSQHQVLVLTTVDIDTIEISHPRLTIARPAKSWQALYFPKFLQAIMMFRPEVIHTFVGRPSRLPGALTVWPYLHSLNMMLPGVRRYSTVFESDDLGEKDPALLWHQGSRACVVFSKEQKSRLTPRLNCAVEISPLELEAKFESAEEERAPYLLIPAPVSEWKNPEADLNSLLQHLIKNLELHVRVVGGWGDWPASSRRRAWAALMPIADRLHMQESATLAQLAEFTGASQGLWLETLPTHSWRHTLSRLVADQLGKPVIGARNAIAQGSSANFLSRLFAANLA